MARKRKGVNNKFVIIGVVAAVIVLGVVAFFGARAIYENGVNTGRQAESNETSDNLKTLGTAVSEKANFQQAINEVFKELPAELNTEGIDAYITKLEEFTGKIDTEGVKNALSEYLAKWKEFKDIYASGANDKITESFDALKTTAGETASQIKTIYDETIKSTIQNL